MFGLGGTELMIIAGVALLIFGPSQLPRLFRGLGQSVRELKSAAREVMPEELDEKPKQPVGPAPSTPLQQRGKEQK